MTQNRLHFIHIQKLPQAWTSEKILLWLYAGQPMENHRGPTPDESPIDFKEKL